MLRVCASPHDTAGLLRVYRGSESVQPLSTCDAEGHDLITVAAAAGVSLDIMRVLLAANSCSHTPRNTGKGTASLNAASRKYADTLARPMAIAVLRGDSAMCVLLLHYGANTDDAVVEAAVAALPASSRVIKIIAEASQAQRNARQHLALSHTPVISSCLESLLLTLAACEARMDTVASARVSPKAPGTANWASLHNMLLLQMVLPSS